MQNIVHMAMQDFYGGDIIHSEDPDVEPVEVDQTISELKNRREWVQFQHQFRCENRS